MSVNSRQQIEEFSKDLIIQELQSLLDTQTVSTQQISKLINNLQQKSTDDRNESVIKSKKCIIQGWLQKKSNWGYSYNRRWFVLYSNNELAYYEKPEHMESNKTPKGHISLYEVTDLKTVSHKTRIDTKSEFELITQKRTFILKSEDEDSYNTWINTITQRIKPTIIHKGWVLHRNNEKQTWKQRYFVMVNYATVYSEIRYYEDEKMKKYKGMLHISQVMTIACIEGNVVIEKYDQRAKHCVMEIQTKERMYVLGFDTSHVMNEWKDQIIRFKQQTQVTEVTEVTEHSKQEIWTKHETEDGTVYYYNKTTGESQWKTPHIAVDLPKGWIQLYSENGTDYYFNESAGITQWKLPVHMMDNEHRN